MRKIKVDFYGVTMPKNASSLEAILGDVHKTKCDAKRNVQIHNTPVRLQEGGDTIGDYCAGDLVRIQLSGFPADAGLDGTTKRLDLGHDHGLGHETAFLYYKPWKVLLLQRNQSGVSPAAFAHYIEDRGDLPKPIELDPVPLSNARKKLNKFKRFRHVRIRLAAVGRVAAVQDEDNSANDILKVLSQMQTPATSRPVMDIDLGVRGPRYDSLEPSAIRKTISAVLKIARNVAEVERLDVSASEDKEGKLEVLHYLNFVLTDEQDITAEHKSVPYHRRTAALKKSFEAKLPELQEIYGNLPATTGG